MDRFCGKACTVQALPQKWPLQGHHHGACDSSKNHERDLLTHHPHALHRLGNQLPQGVLLPNHRDGKLDRSSGPDHLVHQRSVSPALSSSAYAKMVGGWLIFTQIIPWVEVHSHWSSSIVVECSFRHYFTVHTAIEETRQEKGACKINHHGMIIELGLETFKITHVQTHSYIHVNNH